jgi:hypothetical protein
MTVSSGSYEAPRQRLSQTCEHIPILGNSRISIARSSRKSFGDELGGRPRDRKFYCDGAVDYEKVATGESFKKGLDRVLNGAKKYRIALMCSENNPLDCHRCLLVGRALSEHGVEVRHIIAGGKMISQQEVEDLLIKECGHGGDDMFAKGSERLAEAYRARSRKVSFRSPDSEQHSALE